MVCRKWKKVADTAIFGEIDAFLSPSVIAVQIQTACEGLNLQHFQEIYFSSPHFNPAVEMQAIARAHRIGQLDKVNVFRFVMKEFSDPLKDGEESDEEEGEEGQILTRTHRYRERNTKLVARKKQHVLQEKGTLSCEVCGFDFSAAYGGRGDGFIECHHTKPVSEMKAGERTSTKDLSLVCANCHRMIHYKRPWFSIEELKSVLT